MENLAALAHGLTLGQQHHQEHLRDVHEMAERILETLTSVSLSLGSLRGFLLGARRYSRWWPCVVCPATTLVVGSYGLPPSTMRNLLLFVLGVCAFRLPRADMMLNSAG